MPSPLQRRTTVVLLWLVTACIAVPGLTELVVRLDTTRDQIDRAQMAQAKELRQAIDGALKSMQLHLERVVSLPLDRTVSGGTLRREEYQRLLQLMPTIASVRYLDRHGRERQFVSRSDLDVASPAETADASAPVILGACPHMMAHRDSTAEPLLIVSVCEPGPLGGRTEVTVRLRELARQLSAALSPVEPGTDYLVVDRDGVVLMHQQQARMLGATQLSEPLREQLLRPEAVSHARGDSDSGVPLVASALPQGIPDIWVVVSQVASLATAPIWQTLMRTLGFLAAGLLATTLAARTIAHRLTRPILALHSATAAIGRGQLDTRVDLRTGDELEQVGEAFNTMAAQLRSSYADLEARVAERTQAAAAAQQAAERAYELADQARQEAERANRQKTEFLAHMSHELRTPLHALLGFAEAMEEQIFGPLNAKQQDYIREILASGQLLLQLINDLLDLARIEAGQLELHVVMADVPMLLRHCEQFVRERALRKDLRLRYEVDPGVSSWPLDERRFKQVVLNLLGNAVKFTPAGGTVWLRARVDPQAGLCVEVEDTGIGIAPERVGDLFAPFSQAVDDGRLRAEGAGLGLALCRQFVEALGGHIGLDSTPGQGSVFRFCLPPGPR